MARHIWINPDRLPDPRTEQPVEGIDLIVELSPYDTPTTIVGEYDDLKGRFLITFEYIDDEPGKVDPSYKEVEVLKGKHSGKLLRISIPIDQPPLDTTAVIHLRTEVLDALRHISGERGRGRMNRSVARELVSENFDELAGELVAAH